MADRASVPSTDEQRTSHGEFPKRANAPGDIWHKADVDAWMAAMRQFRLSFK